jgi:hypothetical protein
MKNELNNLYILEGVLADYTSGMAVIAAPSLGRCWEIFDERFGNVFHERMFCDEVKVVEGVNHAEGVVSYVYGGG